MTGAAIAASPAAPPARTAATFTGTADIAAPVAIPDGGAATPGAAVVSRITVADSRPLLDLDVTTRIKHTFSSDLTVTLTSPRGTTVVLYGSRLSWTDPNAPGVIAGRDDVFNGRVFDDQAAQEGTATVFQDNVATPAIVPEGALGAFIGENPQGQWTLRVTDDDAGETGTLEGWSLAGTVLNEAPALTTTSHTSTTTPTPIPDATAGGPGVVSSDITVTGAGPYLWDADLTTAIRHTAAEDLDITLSHAGKTVTITSDNGDVDDNVFDGTVWDDRALFGGTQRPVTRAVFVNGVVQPRLTPEGAMAAFAGTDPNGVWRLRIVDDATADAGTLRSWKLDLSSAAAPPAPVDPVTPDPVTPVTPADPATPGPTGGPATPATPAAPVGTGTPITGGPATPPRTALVRVTGISAPNTVPVRGTLRIVARFNQPPLGGRVVLQRKVGKRFLIVGRAPVRNGRAILTYRPAKAGRQVLRVRFRDASGLRYSRIIAVRVRAAR